MTHPTVRGLGSENQHQPIGPGYFFEDVKTARL